MLLLNSRGQGKRLCLKFTLQETGEPGVNGKPCGDTTASGQGQGSKSQIDLNQLPCCGYKCSAAHNLCVFHSYVRGQKSKFDVVDLKPRTDPSSQAAVLRIHSLLKAISQKQNKQLITGMLLVFSTVLEVGSYLNVTQTI